MQITIGLGDIRLMKASRYQAHLVRPFLHALTMANRVLLRTHHVPKIYEAGVRWQNEPADGSPEEFASCFVVISRGWGDCDDLAPWRCAELREAGENARIRITWRKKRSGMRVYHVLVRRGDGSIEDPSALLGMND
jgi:hypothetical protein